MTEYRTSKLQYGSNGCYSLNINPNLVKWLLWEKGMEITFKYDKDEHQLILSNYHAQQECQMRNRYEEVFKLIKTKEYELEMLKAEIEDLKGMKNVCDQYKEDRRDTPARRAMLG